MASNFKQLVAALSISPLNTNVLHQIIILLGQQSSKPFDSLLCLQQWAWKLLSQNCHQWINQPDYQQLFYALALFNKNLIFHCEDIEIDAKATLLFSVTIDQIDNIFKQLQNTQDDNDPFITLISLWFDNNSYFIQDNPTCNELTIVDHVNHYIIHNYVISKQFKFYLTQLRQSPIEQTIFTSKMLFYIKTCVFSLFAYIAVRNHSFPCTDDEMLHSIQDDYIDIIHIQSLTVASWSKELLTCMGHLISFAAALCWWNGQKQTQTNILFPTEQITCDHVQDLINIIAYKPFQKQIKTVRENDETILIDGTLMMLITIVEIQDINWFFRSNSTIQSVLLSVGEISLFNEICLCVYGILGKVLTEDQLKDVKIAETITDFFFNMLEHAWHQPSKKYKQISIEYLLGGFVPLIKHDFIQQQTADSNKIPLLIEMCDLYPVIYDCFWGLSFNQDIQQQLRSNSNFISKLSHFTKECDNEQMRKIVHGILWNLEINHEDRPISIEQSFDIMISYSHKDKVLCRQIYDELIKAGCRVWIDFDQIHGNVMDAMAQAIERTPTVIICMSEDYRKSNYCRAEAHYTFQRQRKIVPVLLQKHYKPDGWLLFLVGQLLYVDFTKYRFDQAMRKLFKELHLTDFSKSNVAPVPYKQDAYITSSIAEWSHTQVQDWLMKHNLIQMSHLLANCDGRSLFYLSKYMKHSELRHILNSFRTDSLRRLNENLSYIELARFQSLLDEQDFNS